MHVLPGPKGCEISHLLLVYVLRYERNYNLLHCLENYAISKINGGYMLIIVGVGQ